MISIKNKLIYLIIAVIGIMVTACQSTNQSNQIDSQTLFLHLGGEPTYLNPVLSTDSPSSSVEGLIFSGLFKVNANLELEPDLV